MSAQSHAHDRLSALDESFLHIEGPCTPMHVGAVSIFEGERLRDANGWLDQERLARFVEARLDGVPRFRQKLAFVPLGQGRPLWVDDPHFNLLYHLRFSALPAPGDARGLTALVGRLMSQPLDRHRPLWELYVVDGLAGDRVALVWKTHHCMVDGVSGMELAAVLFDLDPDAPEPTPAVPWKPRPAPSEAVRLVDAWLERSEVEQHHRRTLRAALRAPREAFAKLEEVLGGMGSLMGGGLAPKSSLNVPIGPHRRFETVRIELARAKALKNALGGTVNDVVLAAVTGALRALFLERGDAVTGVELHTLVPVSVRSADESGALGNRVSALVVALPLGEKDPRRRLGAVRERMAALKQSHEVVGAEMLTRFSGFAPATLLQQAARLQSAQRFVNLVVTNVPGPQLPLYLLGARLTEVFPCVPLAPNLAMSVAVVSYDGALGFGLIGDWDAMADLASLAAHLERAFAELEALARPHARGKGTRPAARRASSAARPRRRTAP